METCNCYACQVARLSRLPWPQNLGYTMALCPTCGYKRCPGATDHDNSCTGSNDPGQVGSRYA